MPKPLVDLTSKRFGRLVVLNRAEDPFAGRRRPRRRWHVRCDCGTEHTVVGSDLRNGHTKSCGCLRREIAALRAVTVPAYNSMHQRLHRRRGSASQYSCMDCDGPAAQWSYDCSDPEEHVGTRGARYSTKVEHYHPRCIVCHKRFDREQRMTA